MFAKQYVGITRVEGKVDVVVMDSPMLLSIFYIIIEQICNFTTITKNNLKVKTLSPFGCILFSSPKQIPKGIFKGGMAMLPQEVQEFVKERLFVVSDNEIHASTITEGRSGADVYRIKVNSRRKRFTGSYIVKVCNIVQREEEKESYKADLLYQEAPNFTEHLVKVVTEKTIGERSIIIYNQANNSVRNMESFSELNGEMILKYMRQVSFDILSLMNEDVQTGGSVEDFFNCLLSKQLSSNGRFRDRIESLLKNPKAACLPLNGRIYPNPAYFINSISEWGSYVSDPIFLKGIAHGDLHGYNLIASEDSYSLIDYDGVMINTYLLFDHAYFEFSIFYDNSKDNDLKRWHLMLEKLISPSFLNDADPCEYYKEW